MGNGSCFSRENIREGLIFVGPSGIEGRAEKMFMASMGKDCHSGRSRLPGYTPKRGKVFLRRDLLAEEKASQSTLDGWGVLGGLKVRVYFGERLAEWWELGGRSPNLTLELLTLRNWASEPFVMRDQKEYSPPPKEMVVGSYKGCLWVWKRGGMLLGESHRPSRGKRAGGKGLSC